MSIILKSVKSCASPPYDGNYSNVMVDIEIELRSLDAAFLDGEKNIKNKLIKELLKSEYGIDFEDLKKSMPEFFI